MDWRPLWEALSPGSAEKDEGFRQEILRASHAGLRIIGACIIGVTLFLSMGRALLVRESISVVEFIGETVILLGIGVGTLWVWRQPWSYGQARKIAAATGLAVGLISLYFSLHLSEIAPEFQEYVPGQVALIVLGLVAAVPLLPKHAFTVGAVLAVSYVLMAGRLASRPNLLFIAMITLLGVGLSAVLYRQRHSNYESFIQLVRATADVREAQSRLMLSEHAASLGRLSAALSHELNSPVGALTSGVDTLLLLASRQATCPEMNPEPTREQERLVRLQADLRRTIKESAGRLTEILGRIQRFSNLDRADIQPTDLNQVLRDVAALAETQSQGHARLELQLEALPDFTCRPAQMSAAFHSLFSNSTRALNGNGRILVTSRNAPEGRVIVIEDNGRGVPEGDLPHIFDPSFKTANGRIGTGNWSMFSARQIFREHGGDIDIRSKAGEGTRVRIVLPGPGLTAS